MKHFEFTGEEQVFCGVTLKRIRATEDFYCGYYHVKDGDIGGWIEKEENLSDNAWVSDNARVYGNALVSGNAWVSDNARVYGNAWVSDDARVSDNARVFGNAWVFGNALVSDDARVYGNACVCIDARIKKSEDFFAAGPIGSRNDTTTFFLLADGMVGVKCGCFIGTIDEFRRKVSETHGNNKHAKAYMAVADLAELRILGEDDGEQDAAD